jgi:hypothetical protein
MHAADGVLHFAFRFARLSVGLQFRVDYRFAGLLLYRALDLVGGANNSVLNYN